MRLTDSQSRRRVVVTGFGAVTPHGNAQQTWEKLLDGKSAITRIEQDWADHVPVRIAGQATDFDPAQYLAAKDMRRIPRPSQFAIAATEMAVSNSGLNLELVEHERIGVVMGTTMGPHLLAEEMTTQYRQNGHRRPNPVLFANCLPNMPAHYVSERLKAYGPQMTPIAACATGSQAIGDGVQLIRSGRADVVFAGATEAIIQDYIIAGFASIEALATGFDSDPTAASRPFDADRNGFVLSEGCGVLVLESMQHAVKRNAVIYAEVLGHASSSDAYHIAAIDPNASGMTRCIKWALTDAQILPQRIDYINAHGSSTEANDRLETMAIKSVWGDDAYTTAVSSSKSMLGHAMAAAGAVEAIVSILALADCILPPTINYHTPDPHCDLDYVPNEARETDAMNAVVSANFGLGGQNAAVVFGKV